MQFVAIILAAGSGERLGAALPKALVSVAGKSIVRWSVDAFLTTGECARVVVTYPVGYLEQFQAALDHIPNLTLVPGGASRSASVREGLAALQAQNLGSEAIVLVHDAARCMIGPELIKQVAAAAAKSGAATLAVPVVDTVVRAAGTGEFRDRNQHYGETVPRDGLWAVQTPQAFRFEFLAAAHASPQADATDDAGLVQKLTPVTLVPGDRGNSKITTPEDLRLCSLLLSTANEYTIITAG